MNLAFLKTFLAVVETGNLNRAAERLNVTQSTVTSRLDALEEALGRKLLVRARNGTRLTRAGFELRPYADMLVNGWDQARRAIDLPEGYSGMFSFACEFDLWHDEGKAWLYRHRAAHPTIAYEARPGRRAEMTNWLGSGLTDAALVTEPLPGPSLESRTFTEQRILHVSVLPTLPAHWRETYIFVDLGTDFRRQHSQAMPDAKTAGITFSVSVWALEHLLSHGGSAYLPEAIVAPHVTAGRLHVVAGAPVFTRNIYLVFREATEASFPWITDGLPQVSATSGPVSGPASGAPPEQVPSI